MKRLLTFGIAFFVLGFSSVFAQQPQDALLGQQLEDTLQVDLAQQNLDVLFARASGGLVKYAQLADSSKKTLINMGEEIVPYLLDKIGSKDVRETLASIDILKAIGSPAVPYLIESLADTSNTKVGTIIRTLGEMKDKQATGPLVRMLDNGDFRIRGGACTALGLIGDTVSADYLIPALNDTANLVRKSAAFALGEIGAPKAISYLMKLLSDEYYGVRFAAGNSLVKFGPLAVKPLIPLLGLGDMNLRCLVIEILGKTKDKKAFESLLVNLASPDWAIRGFTVEALGNLGNGRATKAIKDLEKTEVHPFVKRKIEEALQKAIKQSAG